MQANFLSFVYSLLLIYLHAVHDVEAYEECDNLGVHFYEELSCIPFGSKECPNRYRCDSIQNIDGCMFNGKYYDLGEFLEDDISKKICKSCQCVRTENWIYKFNCSLNNLGLEENRNTTNLRTCEISGQTYFEGDKFYSNKKCIECVCSKNYSVAHEDQYCQKPICGSQLYFSKEIEENCAPLYNARKGDILCCPKTFICPTLKEDIKPVSKIYSRLKCTFGNKILKKGEGFEAEYKEEDNTLKAKCECYFPPFVTCWNM